MSATKYRHLVPFIGLASVSSFVAACGGAAPPSAEPAPTSPAAPLTATKTSVAPALQSAPVEALPTDFDGLSYVLASAAPVDTMNSLCTRAIATADAKFKELVDDAGVGKQEAPGFYALNLWDEAELAIGAAAGPAELLSQAHADAKVREAAKNCAPALDAWQTKLWANADLFAAAKRMEERIGLDAMKGHGAKMVVLPEAKRYVGEILRDFRRGGAALSAADKETLAKLNERITNLELGFQENLSKSRLTLEVMPSALEGLPKDYVASHAPGANGKVSLSTDYPDANPFFQYAKDRNTARALYTQFDNRAADKNVALLEELLGLRQQKAKLLGYATWADYVLEPRMAGKVATVKGFLSDVAAAVAPRVQEEMKDYKAEAKTLGLSNPDKPYLSDRIYLEDRVKQKKYAFDSSVLREYFPVHAVRDGLLAFTSKAFGLRFEPIEAPVWAPGVIPMHVIDANTNEVLGQFYFDLAPRDGKYKHAAVFGLRTTKAIAGKGRLMPMAAIVCNFAPDTASGQGLMRHDEVTTFFHEFGHVLHHILSRASYAHFGGTQVARDFVEAPSQMLEEWAWDEKVLASFAKHVTTGKTLPHDLYKKLVAARAVGRGVTVQRQLFLATLDHVYHTETVTDSTATMNRVFGEMMPFTQTPNSHFQATFGHLMGYDAGYYGYQWALSIAQDMHTRFEGANVMNLKTWREYRERVLERGGSDAPEKLVENFLGRAPNSKAYKAFLLKKP